VLTDAQREEVRIFWAMDAGVQAFHIRLRRLVAQVGMDHPEARDYQAAYFCLIRQRDAQAGDVARLLGVYPEDTFTVRGYLDHLARTGGS
jgi:hypothetical protein